MNVKTLLTRHGISKFTSDSEQDMTDTKIDFGNLEGNIESPDSNSSFARKGLAFLKFIINRVTSHFRYF